MVDRAQEERSVRIGDVREARRLVAVRQRSRSLGDALDGVGVKGRRHTS
jgi:hypothetical protein